MKRRMLCALLALVLCAGLLPAASLAAEAPSQTELPVTETSEIPSVPEGTTPPENADASDNTDRATVVDTSDDTDTSDTTDVTDDTDTSDDTDVSNDTDTSDDADTSDNTDTSDDTDRSGETDESDDVDAADDTDSADASDEVQAVAMVASVSDGTGESTTITLNTQMEAVEVGQQFTLTLMEAGDYYLAATNATLRLPAKWDGSRVWMNGEVLQLSAGTYTFTTVTTGNFTLSPLSERSFDSMSVGKTSVNTGESLSKYIYAFKAENEGDYVLVPQGAGVSVAVYGTGYDYDGSYTARSTVLTLKKDQTIWVEILATGAGSVQLIDLANTKDLAMNTVVTVAAGEVYTASIPSGWYVLETSGADVVSTPRNGGFGWLADSTAARQIFVPQTGNSEPGKGGNSGGFVFAVNSAGTIKLRAAVAGDFTSMSVDTQYTNKGAYCFTASRDGHYKITQNSASLYDANGQSLSIGWAGYRTMTAGESLYVTLGDYENQFVKIEKKDIPTIALGDMISVQCRDAVRYSYTAPKAGLYCCLLCGDATYGDGANLSSPNYQNFHYGWFSSGSSRSGYYFLPLNEGQQVYFDLSMANLPSGTGEATMTFNTVEAVFPVKTLNTQFTASKDYDGFRYTPDATGLYVVSNTGTGTGKMYENGIAQAVISNGRTYVTLEGGKTYIFVTEKANDTVIVQTPGQYGTTPIGLNDPKTSSRETLYCFTAPSAGIYSIACENGIVAGYDSAGQLALNGGSATQTCTLDANEKLYLILSPSEGSEAKLTVRQDDLSGLTALELDTVYNKNMLTESRYVFQAENAGVYVMTQTEQTDAQVMVENSGNRAPEGRIVLFSLAAGQKALITIPVRPTPPEGGPEGGGPNGGEQQSADTLKITALSSAQVVDVTEEDTELPTADNIYRFTAPADGEYEFSLSVGGMIYRCDVYYYNQSLRQSVMYFNGSDDPSDLRDEHIACTMSKGETVYFVTRCWGGNNEPGGGSGEGPSGEPETGVTKLHVDGLPKVTPTPETVVEKLAAIDETAAPEEIRDAVQDIDKGEMTEALESDSNVVDKLAELESKISGSVTIVVTDEAADVGVSKSVTIIGAKLNNLAEGGNDIVLTIDSTTEEKELPEGIAAENAIHLTIDLEGVENPHKLAVPVCLTIAVPENMKPENVCLVHYAEGAAEPEILWPTVYQENGEWYARFVIGGFSHFVLAELAANDDSGSAGGDSGSGTQKPAARGHSPKTGDESRLALWAAVLLLACGGAVQVLKKKHN